MNCAAGIHRILPIQAGVWEGQKTAGHVEGDLGGGRREVPSECAVVYYAHERQALA